MRGETLWTVLSVKVEKHDINAVAFTRSNISIHSEPCVCPCDECMSASCWGSAASLWLCLSACCCRQVVHSGTADWRQLPAAAAAAAGKRFDESSEAEPNSKVADCKTRQFLEDAKTLCWAEGNCRVGWWLIKAAWNIFTYLHPKSSLLYKAKKLVFRDHDLVLWEHAVRYLRARISHSGVQTK